MSAFQPARTVARRVFLSQERIHAMSLLPIDLDNQPIQVLGLKRTDGVHQIAISATSARNTTGFNATTRVISIFATVDCFVEQGDESVIATTSRHLVPAGIYLDLDIGGGKTSENPYLAVISSGPTGTLFISERE
jgi:hypothetical protein